MFNFISDYPVSGERFSVTYKLTGDEKEAYDKAKDICLEQTVEFPDDLVPHGFIRDFVVGKIESFEPGGDFFRSIISYSVETSAFEFTQLLNVIFGNISIKPGIMVESFDLPESLLRNFKGPRFGIKGLRDFLGIYNCPLLCTALKPMGLSSEGLAELAYKFALGGIDIIKDDHGLSNQPFAPFEKRVKLCSEAIAKANKETGYNCIYVPNITSSPEEMKRRAKFAKEAGAKGFLISPGLTGLEAMKEISDDEAIALPVISHPAFQGSYVLSANGISHYALFGQIARLAGGDATIYPNFGGRFSFSRNECDDIVKGSKVFMHNIKSIFPCPGGGMKLENVPDLFDFYGEDVIYLIGGGLFKHSDNLIENCKYFRKMVQR